MAGGKETPRQKMIGMMYLVLTALLALNVSKSILDAFVAIEENIQVANLSEYARGAEKKGEISSVAADKTIPAKQKKAKYYLAVIEDIDKMTAERIKMIDDIKIEILKKCGEDVTTIGGKESIIFKKYSANDPLLPTRMHLEHVAGKDKYDEAMEIMIGEDIKNPKANGSGMKLWNSYNDYRTELTEKIANSWIPDGGKKYSFKAPKINAFKDFEDLNAQIDKAIKASNVNNADKDVIKKIYAKLTKQEKSTVHEIPGVHWIGKTFDHSPSVAAIASLSSMQNEILAARAEAIALIQERVGGSEYSFNKIMAIALGDEVATEGGDIEVSVMMAAFDSDRQPVVNVTQGASVSETKNGMGIIRTRASGGNEMVLKGTVSITNKFGSTKTENWEKKIVIVKPQGTVSLPEMNVLYRGYNNLVEGVAAGYEKTDLRGTGVTLKPGKKSGQYIGTVTTTGREASIDIYGKSSKGNKNAKVGTYKFRVSNLPPPQVYLGTLGTGSTVSKTAVASMTRLFARYPPEIPLSATFEVASWEITVSGAPRSIMGSGPTLTADAISLLKQTRPGAKVSISAKYKGMGYSGNMATIITVQ